MTTYVKFRTDIRPMLFIILVFYPKEREFMANGLRL